MEPADLLVSQVYINQSTCFPLFTEQQNIIKFKHVFIYWIQVNGDCKVNVVPTVLPANRVLLDPGDRPVNKPLIFFR